jgi:hypothetical protein
VRPIYDFERNEDFEEYRRGTLTVASIRADMSKFREWEKEVEKMRVQYAVGCLYVDSKRMKSELQPITVRGMENIKGLLKDLAREKCREGHTLLSTRAKTLGACLLAAASSVVVTVVTLPHTLPESLISRFCALRFLSSRPPHPCYGCLFHASCRSSLREMLFRRCSCSYSCCCCCCCCCCYYYCCCRCCCCAAAAVISANAAAVVVLLLLCC